MRRIAPWAVASITVAGLVAAALLDPLASPHDGDLVLVIAWVVATGASTAVGLVLATRRPRNPIGWLLLRTGSCSPRSGWRPYRLRDARATRRAARRRVGVLFSERGWPLLFVGVTAIAWVFPDGRLPSPRWRPYALAAAASVAALVALSFSGRVLQREVRATSRARCRMSRNPRIAVLDRGRWAAPSRPWSPACSRCGRASGARRASSGSS